MRRISGTLAGTSFLLFGGACLLLSLLTAAGRLSRGDGGAEAAVPREIVGEILPGDTLSGIFQRHGLSPSELSGVREAAASVHRLRRILPGNPYRIVLGRDNDLLSLTYRIDRDHRLRIERGADGFAASREPVPYETRRIVRSGTIANNLVSALGEDGESVRLALRLSDLFAWDIDFATDLKPGDSYRVLVEERRLDGAFQGYGEILAAEFVNSGTPYRAFRFDDGSGPAYFDEEGQALARAFLKAPLSYRRISSRFSRSRLHPVHKVRRPHLGVDYVAPAGTPVSALGDGTVRFAGRKGANGILVILDHPMGYRTYYGHLLRVARGIRPGTKVSQGQVIGYVGRTGLATGPHLDFRIRKGAFLDPLSVSLPRGRRVPESRTGEYHSVRAELSTALAGNPPQPGRDRLARTR